MASSYDLGDLVRVSGAFTNSAGTAQDPTVVKASVRTPAGVVTTYTYGVDAGLVKDSTGNYHLDVSAAEIGWYYYRWFSTGTGQAADEGWFEVVDARAR
jgi:hypothetical protein